jgi:hypothetical protein
MKKIGDFVKHIDLHYLVMPICFTNFKGSFFKNILCMLIDVHKKHSCKFLDETRSNFKVKIKY